MNKVNKSAMLLSNAIIGVFGSALYFSLRTMLCFVGYVVFPALPYILGVLSIVSMIFSLILLFKKGEVFKKGNDILLIVTLVYNCLILAFSTVYFFVIISHFLTFLVELCKILAIYLFAGAVVYLCFFHGKAEYKGKKAVSVILCAVIITSSVLVCTDLSSLRVNYVETGAAVYAVGEEYQIVWTTRNEGIAWVEIDGKEYYDEFAGSKRSNESVHKVTVPQSVLDEAKGYTVYSRAQLSEQGYSGILGYTIKKSYSFRPVDTGDGIQTYVISDNHMFNNPAVKASSYYGDDLDFVVLNGDHVDYIDSELHLNNILSLAHRASMGGTRPIVFARGNHETKGNDAESLTKYVGSRNEVFYYTFRLANVWGIVLDIAEDYEDDWKEYYGTAIYSQYRKKQIEYLDGIIADKSNEYEADGVEYRIGVSHISTAVVENNKTNLFSDMAHINDRLNVMNLDVMMTGHFHHAYKIEGGYETGKMLYYREEYSNEPLSDTPDLLATGANYPSIVSGRSSGSMDPSTDTQPHGGKYIGVAIELGEEGKYARFTNEKGEVNFSINPFENVDYGKIITL